MTPTNLPNGLNGPPNTDDVPTVISQRRAATGKLGEQLRGRILSHFELLEPLGIGGMAAVMRAVDLQMGRIVAIKILPPDLAADPEMVTRFQQEAQAAARLDHDNVARAYFSGEDQGVHFIVFEYVEGQNLKEMIDRRGLLPPKEAVRYLAQTAMGLAHAASRGVVHRDLKPSNIIIGPGGVAKIVDMGLARRRDGSADPVTQPGVTLGTFDYMSPEQALEPRLADSRSDIYSLGCTFYHALTGHSPVPAGTAARKLHHQQNVAPVDPRGFNPDIPAELVVVLGRMIAKNPSSRYQKPEELLTHLAVVARSMGVDVPGLPAPRGVTLPKVQPPGGWGISQAAVGSVLAVVMFVLFLELGGWSDVRRADTTTPNPPELRSPAAEVAGEIESVEDAATTEELRTLLAKEAVNIRLTASSYVVPNSASGRGLVFTGRRLQIAAADPNRPVEIRLAAPKDSENDGPAPATLTISGDDRTAVTLRGLAFPSPPANGGPNSAHLMVARAGRVVVDQCTFSGQNGDMESSLTSSITVLRTAEEQSPLHLQLNRCAFLKGQRAVNADGPVALTALDCVAGPHDAVWHVGSTATKSQLSMERCSFLMERGCVAHFQAVDEATVRMAGCIVAAGQSPSNGTQRPSVIRQTGGRTGAITISPMMLEPGTTTKNFGFGLGSLGNCMAQQFKPDTQSGDWVELTSSPWLHDRPLELLAGNPSAAFSLNWNNPALRRAWPQGSDASIRGPWPRDGNVGRNGELR